MTETFYTDVQIYGARILYRGVENGQRVRRRIDYSPSLFVSSKEPTKFRTIYGEYVAPVTPGNIRDCRDFVQKYKDVSNFQIYGNSKYEYSFLFDNFKDDVRWNLRHIRVANIDIEVESDDGFPEPEDAAKAITAITIKYSNGKFIAFGCGDFTTTRTDITYHRCVDEIDLIRKFLDVWTADYPDIITGWNVKLFDIPYLVNRITRVLGEDFAKKLSPWGVITERKVHMGVGRVLQAYKLVGISILDYMDLYVKFAPEGKSQESYKLDNICHVELKERKLSYDEYGDLFSLYKKNFQLFMEYNIRDTELIDKLEGKLKLIELALTLAYDSKTVYDDVFMQTRMWEQIIHCYLMKKGIVMPPSTQHSKDKSFDGAYVKDPLIGLHGWLGSFDLTSLYPSLYLQYNISPETLVQPHEYTSEMRQIADKASVESFLRSEIDTAILKKNGVTMTPNGQFFRTDSEGFMPAITRTMFDDRQRYKKEMIKAQKELELESDPVKREEIENRVSRYKNLQLAKKVSLNSLYGASGTPYFRFFDLRIALAITLSGQLAIQWIEAKLNKYMNGLLKTDGEDYVIASDTDSIYLNLAPLVGKTIKETNPDADDNTVIGFLDKICEAKLQPYIDKSYQELAGLVNAYAQKMIMKREALCNKGIWTAKKRYILNVFNQEGVQYAKPEIKIMGLEVKKSSTPSFFREKMERCIEIVINETEEALIDYIAQVKEEMRKVNVADIAFPRGVNGIGQYTDKKTGLFVSATPIHVRGSILYNYHIKKAKLEKKYEFIKDGEKIKWIYLKTPNPLLSNNVVSFPFVLPEELDLMDYIDYDTQFEKAFIEPFKIITDKIGWKCEKTASILDFFS